MDLLKSIKSIYLKYHTSSAMLIKILKKKLYKLTNFAAKYNYLFQNIQLITITDKNSRNLMPIAEFNIFGGIDKQ